MCAMPCDVPRVDWTSIPGARRRPRSVGAQMRRRAVLRHAVQPAPLPVVLHALVPDVGQGAVANAPCDCKMRGTDRTLPDVAHPNPLRDCAVDGPETPPARATPLCALEDHVSTRQRHGVHG